MHGPVRRVRRFLSRLQYDRAVRRAVRTGVETCIVQSCDESYLPFYAITRSVNRRYAQRHAYAYFGLVGNLSPVANRGNFNRYYLLRELQAFKSLRWAVWMDADAMFVDHRLRLETITDRSPEKMLIACRGADHGPWDINNGVFFLNLQHPQASRMLDDLIETCDHSREEQAEFVCDQAIMHDWLRRRMPDAQFAQHIMRYSGSDANLFNYDGPFVQHVLREFGSFEQRLDRLKEIRGRCQRV